MFFYILRRDGQYAGVTMWSGSSERPRRFVVNDGTKRYEIAKHLYEGTAKDWPPMPRERR
jgi:N4-(beta-N-acetylglucosaminyl)-L-asparaginase